jgi:methyltransferase (TIGR00027 family)
LYNFALLKWFVRGIECHGSAVHIYQERKGDLDIMRNIIAATIFRMIQIILFPVALVSYVIFVVKLIMFSRKSGVSATALASLYTRWMQHKLGTRHDWPGERLMMVLPNVSPLGLRFLTYPTLLAHRLTGYVPRIYHYPYEGAPPITHESAARTTFFDAALARHLGEIEQLVVLGAGWDTRSFRLPEGTRVRCFELDTPKTQKMKREMLEKVGLNTTRVTFVTADFLGEDWLEKLVNAGFDPGKPSFFLWEGVTMYLDREAVENTLRKIAGTAKGGVVAFDYFSADLIEAPSIFMRYAKAVVDAIGEPLRFGIECKPPARKCIAAFLESCGLTMEEQINFGAETDRKCALAGFVTAIV